MGRHRDSRQELFASPLRRVSLGTLVGLSAAFAVCSYALPAAALQQYRQIASNGRAERPTSQAGVPSTTSYIERTITWPTGTYNALEFDYYVDSETGYDFLTAKVDGTSIGSWSGIGKAGHVSYPVSAGSHTIRFEYSKDSSVDRGRDTGWVDNVRAVTTWGGFEEHRFEGSAITGWTTGGSGSWTVKLPQKGRALRRPTAQAFAGYQSTSTTSAVERSMSFTGSTSNRLAFNYLVDSETNYDFLRVLVDGALVWSTSGYDAGSKEISVSAGTHTVRFEYLKDTSVDVGRDLAMVDDVLVLSDDATYEWHDLDDYALGAVPFGWTASGNSGGWVTADAWPDRIFVDTSVPTTPPTVDGVVGATEWSNETVLHFADTISTTGPRGTLYLRADGTSKYLYVGARVGRATSASGGEAGHLAVVFDVYRLQTLKTQGCGGNGVMPGQGDRKFDMTYADSSVTVHQYIGSCAGWTEISLGDASAWPISVAASEPASDPGFFDIEARITAKASSEPVSIPFVDGKVGFAALHENTSGTLTREVFPLKTSRLLDDVDVATWVTIDLVGDSPNTWRPLDGLLLAVPRLHPARPRL